ncbi:hypothetical protein Q3G72_003204 [Acer saccharum]|nr:hypothetical protein Q3G72_003204 [Acer saccharum]
MSQFTDRKIDLYNKTGKRVKIKTQHYPTNIPDYYLKTIEIEDQDHKAVSASALRRSSENSGRSTVIKLFLGDEDTKKALSPQDFIDFVRIFFRVDEQEQLVVYGIRATLMDQFSRIKLFGFLKKGDYSEREEEFIV